MYDYKIDPFYRVPMNAGHVFTSDMKVGQVVQPINYKLEKDSVKVRCMNCSAEQFTRVDSKISSNGIAWAVLCCFCGSWLLSLLVLCMEGFREFIHYCPSCNAIVGTYTPTFSGGLMCLLVFLSILVVGMQIAILMFVVF